MRKGILFFIITIVCGLPCISQFHVKSTVEIMVKYEDSVRQIPKKVYLHSSNPGNKYYQSKIVVNHNSLYTFYNVLPGKYSVGLTFSDDFNGGPQNVIFESWISKTTIYNEETGLIKTILQIERNNEVTVRKDLNLKVDLIIRDKNSYVNGFIKGTSHQFKDYDYSVIYYDVDSLNTDLMNSKVIQLGDTHHQSESRFDCTGVNSTGNVPVNLQCANPDNTVKINVNTIILTNVAIMEISSLDDRLAKELGIGSSAQDEVTGITGKVLGKFTTKIVVDVNLVKSECEKRGEQCQCSYETYAFPYFFSYRVWPTQDLLTQMVEIMKIPYNGELEEINLRINSDAAQCYYEALKIHEMCHCPQFLKNYMGRVQTALQETCKELTHKYDCKDPKTCDCSVEEEICKSKWEKLYADIKKSFEDKYKAEQKADSVNEEIECDTPKLDYFIKCFWKK